MKRFLALLLLSSSAVTLAEEKVVAFIFPPFAAEEMKLPTPFHLNDLSYEEMKAISMEELRGIMATSDNPDLSVAVRELLERGDQKTILRLVYSLKQGNVEAMGMLSTATLAVVPYLMEDVAHGSLEYYGSYSFGDAITGEGRIRETAVERVASILFMAPEITPKFTPETGECLKAIGRGNPDQIQGLTDQSRYLVQWWLLNKNSFEAGKWEDTRPLPQEITYIDPRKDRSFPRDERWDSEKQPPYGSPSFKLPESFEAWSKRIVDPKRRNLDFVALSWDGTKVLEHPAKSLDPKAKSEERESHKNPAPRNPSEPESRDGFAGRKGFIWITLAAVLMVVFSIVRWLRRKKATGI